MNDNSGAGRVDFFFADSEAMPWRASTFAAGVEVKDLGTANGRVMQMVRFPPGTVFPLHKHEGPEFVYVLEGELIQNGQRLGRGWVSVASAGTVDKDVKSETGCVFLIVYSE
jgi:anti-sigma factor ChrR (cupin superfamily)